MKERTTELMRMNSTLKVLHSQGKFQFEEVNFNGAGTFSDCGKLRAYCCVITLKKIFFPFFFLFLGFSILVSGIVLGFLDPTFAPYMKKVRNHLQAALSLRGCKVLQIGAKMFRVSSGTLYLYHNGPKYHSLCCYTVHFLSVL